MFNHHSQKYALEYRVIFGKQTFWERKNKVLETQKYKIAVVLLKV